MARLLCLGVGVGTGNMLLVIESSYNSLASSKPQSVPPRSLDSKEK